jgi:hypothetical protein
MKANVNKLTNAQKKAIEAECRRTAVEATRKYEVELDSVTLWVLHRCFGFGKKRLQRFYDNMFRERREMQEFFGDKDDCVAEYAMRKFLKDEGIDVQQMYDNQINAERFHVKLVSKG